MAQTLVELFLHVVFSTKNRSNLIHPKIEVELHRYMAGIVANLDSRCLAINGTENHVHLLVSLGKTIAPSDLVRETKKGSTSWLKQQDAVRRGFHWQDGYGAFSVGRSDLPAVRRYIASQKEHHRRVSFEEEFVALLDETGLVYDERYLWG
jgi:REP element-mobilizing transposase RayT